MIFLHFYGIITAKTNISQEIENFTQMVSQNHLFSRLYFSNAGHSWMSPTYIKQIVVGAVHEPPEFHRILILQSRKYYTTIG